MTPISIALSLSTSALLLSGCITVAPDSTSGKVATKTSRIVKAITPERKPTMALPASHSSAPLSQADMALACADNATGQKRIMIIDEQGRQIIKDMSVDCSAYRPAPKPPRTIRIAVDGAGEQVFTIDDDGRAVPLGSSTPQTTTRISAVQPAAISLPPQATAQRATSYYAPTQALRTYRVRSGDNLYAIARRSCTSVSALTAINGILKPYTIMPDQILTLPEGSC